MILILNHLFICLHTNFYFIHFILTDSLMCGQFKFGKFNFHFYKCCLFLSPSLSLWFDNYFLCVPSSALDFILFLLYPNPSFPLNIDLCYRSLITFTDISPFEFGIFYCVLYRVFSISILLVRFDQYTHLPFFYLNQIEHC